MIKFLPFTYLIYGSFDRFFQKVAVVFFLFYQK